MSVDIKENYFLMSFRFNKTKPADFGLAVFDNEKFINQEDNTFWIKRDLYDFGWGKEYAFMKLPKLCFNDLLELLINSNVEANRYGAATILEEEYPNELLNYLMELLVGSSNFAINEKMKEMFEIIQLKDPRNRCKTIGKHYTEIEDDFIKWRLISEKVKEIL